MKVKSDCDYWNFDSWFRREILKSYSLVQKIITEDIKMAKIELSGYNEDLLIDDEGKTPSDNDNDFERR